MPLATNCNTKHMWVTYSDSNSGGGAALTTNKYLRFFTPFHVHTLLFSIYNLERLGGNEFH